MCAWLKGPQELQTEDNSSWGSDCWEMIEECMKELETQQTVLRNVLLQG